MKKILPLAGSLLLLSLNAQAAIVYSQFFDSVIATGDGQPMSSVNWNVQASSNSDVVDPTTEAGLTGNPQARIVADANAPSDPNRVFMGSSENRDFLLWTNDLSPFSSGDLESISWKTRNGEGSAGAASVGTRAVVSIFDGSNTLWFASATLQVYNSTTATDWGSHTVDDQLNPVSWIPFTFTGTSSTLSSVFNVSGAAQSLPSGTVVGLGIYAEMETGGSVARFDDFVVTAIPEPSTYAMIGGLLALGLVMVRRRKR